MENENVQQRCTHAREGNQTVAASGKSIRADRIYVRGRAAGRNLHRLPACVPVPYVEYNCLRARINVTRLVMTRAYPAVATRYAHAEDEQRVSCPCVKPNPSEWPFLTRRGAYR